VLEVGELVTITVGKDVGARVGKITGCNDGEPIPAIIIEYWRT